MGWHKGTRGRRSGEEVTPWIGLGFGLLYLVAVAGVGVAALREQRAEVTAERLARSRQSVKWLARYLAHVDGTEPQAVARAIRQTAREEEFGFCAIVSEDGTIVAHSDPTRVGKVADPVNWSADDRADVQAGSRPDLPDHTILSTRILSPSGKATTDRLQLAVVHPRPAWDQSRLFLAAGYVLLAVLVLYLLAYRFLRRAVRPLAEIQRRLGGCAEPTAENLLALRMNDSYDQISASWNRLIEFVGDMQEQLRRSRLATDVTGAMDGYRSERLTEILMQIPFGVLVIDPDEKISFANRSASGLLPTPGRPLEEVSAGEILDESLRIALLSHEEGERSTGSHARRWIDHTFTRPHGEVTLRFWSVPTSGGEHILFVQDVTQTKQAEQARDQFLYHVTHELRTPLTNIRAYAETLSQGVIDDEQTIRECYNVIMGETERLNRLVEDILNVSQLEVGSARLNLGQVQIDQLIRKVVQDTQGNADAKNVELLLHLPAKMPKVRGDKDRLAVVLTNLIGNAIKYTPDGGRVEVQCLAESGRLRVAVKDTGIGIAPEDQERIFEKFYRVDDRRVAAVPGTGLGLAIAMETARLHGGSLGVESRAGEGSTFTLVLPALDLDESGSGAGWTGTPTQEAN